MSNPWLRGLNAEQEKAVLHDHGPLLILAGAGSGKTTVLVARAGRLIAEKIVDPKALCVMTFTNKAARELKSRVQARLGNASKGMWAGTFHSFGLMILREHYKEAGLPKTFGILDPGDASSIVKEILKDFHNGGKTAYDAERILSLLSYWRERGQTAATKQEEYEEAAEWVLPLYLKRLKNLGMIDFDGLILKPIELLEKSDSLRAKIQSQFQQIMIDEFQDTNLMQMKLIRLMSASHHNLAVVGDDDQSIYGWRGACIQNILDFPKNYAVCSVIRLEQNYRSTPAILLVANSIISLNTARHKKVLRSSAHHDENLPPRVLVFENETEEAEQVVAEIQTSLNAGIHKKEVAVLYRSNSQGPLIEAELRKAGIAYAMTGGTAFFDRKETRDILAYIKCALKPNEIAFRRILNTPPRGIGDKTIDDITAQTEKTGKGFIHCALHWGEAGVDERAGKNIDGVFFLLKELAPKLLALPKTPGENMQDFLIEIGYKTYLEKHAPNALVASNKWKLLEIFSRILDRHFEKEGRTAESLKAFLDSMELRDILENEKDHDEHVQLMTLHACKGLEFNVVFLIGVEEDILPHKTLGSDISEERRLFYVGVTRARKELSLTRVLKRQRHGKIIDSPPSRFLLEIPKEFMEHRIGPRQVDPNKRRAMMAELFKKIDTLGTPT